MATIERWQTAQSYERGFWEGISSQIAEGRTTGIDFYEWRAGAVREKLRRLGLEHLTSGDADLVEVGGGPVGLLPYLPARERLAVDPLEHLYAEDERLSAFRDPEVRYRQGVGESLPADDAAFDMAVVENCIDHVQDMDAVMAELHRVLRPSGVLYLTVNARTAPGYWMHRLISRLRIDPGHPHTLTASGARRLVERGGFEILSAERGSYWRAWREDLKGPGLKPRIKAVLGVSEFVVTLFARKADGSGAAGGAPS